MKYFHYLLSTTACVVSFQYSNANPLAFSSISHKGKLVVENRISKEIGFLDFADVAAASNLYLPHNYVYTYYEAVSTRKRLEKLLLNVPNSLGLRWALMRYYISASNFIGGCDSKAVEQARSIFSTDNYIGCLAYEFVYNRLKKFDKAENWYKRSIIIASQRPEFEYKDIAYNKSVQTDVKVFGTFNNNDPNHLYENIDGTYSRKIATTSKNKGTNYKLVIDDKTTVERP